MLCQASTCTQVGWVAVDRVKFKWIWIEWNSRSLFLALGNMGTREETHLRFYILSVDFSRLQLKSDTMIRPCIRIEIGSCMWFKSQSFMYSAVSANVWALHSDRFFSKHVLDNYSTTQTLQHKNCDSVTTTSIQAQVVHQRSGPRFRLITGLSTVFALQITLNTLTVVYTYSFVVTAKVSIAELISLWLATSSQAKAAGKSQYFAYPFRFTSCP